MIFPICGFFFGQTKADRIREQGVDVYGFGERKTPESFRQACFRFIYTENLLPERSGANSTSDAKMAKPLAGQEEATRLMLRVIAQMDTEDGWANLGTFGKQILNVRRAEPKPMIRPDRIGDDLARKTVASRLSTMAKAKSPSR